MHATARYYTGPGAKELFDVLTERKSEVEKLIGGVSGLVSYTLTRLDEGGFSLTVCNDKAGCDESTRIAGEWVRENAGHLNPPTAMVSEGEVILKL
jgi:hypothetical protein